MIAERDLGQGAKFSKAQCLQATLWVVSYNLQVFLVFGQSGWIGGLVGQILKERGLNFEYATARLEDRSSIQADLDRVSLKYSDASLAQLRFKNIRHGLKANTACIEND